LDSVSSEIAMSEKEENLDRKQNIPDLGDIDSYFKPRRTASRIWMYLVIVAALVLLVVIYKVSVIDQSASEGELQTAIELFDISSEWVVRKRVDTEDFRGIILVPSITFRIRNIGERELKSVFLLGVFSFLDTGKTIGEGFKTVLRKPLPPAGESSSITLTSLFGYRASSEVAFEKHAKDWRTSYVDIFVRSRQSRLFLLKTFYISRKIKGRSIDVKI
jgi:hypothetical protein